MTVELSGRELAKSIRAAAAALDPGLVFVAFNQSPSRQFQVVQRRLLAEPIGMVFAARGPGLEFQHLPELEVVGLGDADARALLGSSVRFMMDAQVRDRIIAETQGNPLALLELPRGLSATQLAGGLEPSGTQELKGRIEESFARRLKALPEDTQRLLLVAAAEMQPAAQIDRGGVRQFR